VGESLGSALFRAEENFIVGFQSDAHALPAFLQFNHSDQRRGWDSTWAESHPLAAIGFTIVT
jgi:hypothetical protein